jgi:hypothetical protein
MTDNQSKFNSTNQKKNICTDRNHTAAICYGEEKIVWSSNFFSAVFMFIFSP